ncbi:MAG: Gfo/Idh/MocA family oxidoreductase [Alphaproteobacteria bacterium]|nr:Gfo/Idh/MocA family oxidoreductase [Alphaproteobacteria bacterium]
MGLRLGILGLSPGNGHPFSFSAIVNGYDDKAFGESSWPVIHDYLRRRQPDEFGLGDVQVTHAWTQDADTTRKLCAASRIAHAVADPKDMLGRIDAAVVARDDQESHWLLARPFLEAGLPVFVDKPLSTDPAILARFRPYLESGKLMSCAGLRYAGELDEARRDIAGYGEIVAMRAAVINGWETYGIHLLEAILGLPSARPVAVSCARNRHEQIRVHMDQGWLATIDCLGEVPPQFSLTIHGRARTSTHELRDNFTAFKRLLTAFVGMARGGKPAIPPADTLCVMKTLIAGRRSATTGGRMVELAEVRIDG